MNASLMMDDSRPPRRRRSKRGMWILLLLIVLGLAIVAAVVLHDPGSRLRPNDQKTVKVVLPPPPPPPPPPEVKPQEKPPEPKPTPVEQPQTATPPPPTPAAQPTAGDNALTARAGAGPSNYGLAQGNGGGTIIGTKPGSSMGGFNRAGYASYLQGEFRRIVENDKRLRSSRFKLQVQVWIDATGKITQVDAGDAEQAPDIRSALVGRTVRAPDPSLRMPVIITLEIRRDA